MSPQVQTTLKNEVSCTSVGLHSGRKVRVTIAPAPPDAGIVFVRKDVAGHNRIKASMENLRDTRLATTIGINGTSVSTVEHLLSALRGLNVDNAIVEVDGPEVPIMDGSSLPYVSLLKEAGILPQDKAKKYLVVKRQVSVSDGVGTAVLLPSREFIISCSIDFPHAMIGEQSCNLVFSPAVYEEQICAARTFGFLKDVEDLQAKGLALGGSLKNVIVLNDDRIINKEGLRSPDEFVKHKVLDAIGDLSLLGMPIQGHFLSAKSGHKLNTLLLQELISHRDNYYLVDGNGAYPTDAEEELAVAS